MQVDQIKNIFNVITVVLFVIAYVVKGIFVATQAVMFVTVVSFAYLYFYARSSIQWEDYMKLVFITVLGGITLWLKDDFFIKLKLTAGMWVLAITQYISSKYYNKSWVAMLCQLENVSDTFYRVYDDSLAFFYFFMGCVNIAVALYCSTHTWVLFKTLGLSIAQLAFLGVIFVLLQRQKLRQASSKVVE